MRKVSLAIIGMACLGLASTTFGSTVCHNYIVKVNKQLDACGKNVTCLEAPFKHAMNIKNYSTLYMGCKNAFDAEISDRLAMQSPSKYGFEGLDAQQLQEASQELQKLMAQQNEAAQAAASNANKQDLPEPAWSTSQASASCKNAFYFLSYATKSCKTGHCIDQQYKNTIQIPAFMHCSSQLVSLRESRKYSLMNENYAYFKGYQYTPKVPVSSQASN